MFKKISRYVLGILVLVLVFFVSSNKVFAATATFTGTATMTASSSTTVTVTASGTTLTKFVHANGLTADSTDLSGVVFNGQTAIAAVTNGTNLVTFTFPISAGTYATGSLVIQAGVVVDTISNSLTTINAGSITDNAPPQILNAIPGNTSMSNDRHNPIVVYFSEPMTTSSIVFSTNPVFNYTAAWTSGNSIVSLSHDTFSSGQLITATISAGTDASVGLNSIASVPYIWTFSTTLGASGTVVVPKIPTNMSISVNNGETTVNSMDVVLTIGATDASSMMISNNPFFSNSGWETYSVSKNWTLTPGDGLKKIYIKFISSSGVESDSISTSVDLSNIVKEDVVKNSSPVIVQTCDYPTPAQGCSYVNGSSYDSTTHCGMILNCSVADSVLNDIIKYNFGDKILKNGSTGEAVKELQRFLNANLNLGLVVDGKLGPKTIAIIKKWQKANKLKADGLVGTQTKKLMNSMVK